MQFIRNNILGLVAIFIALSGTAFAAGLAKNSVKSKQIKDAQVKSVDVADNGITGTDVDESTLSGLTATPTGTADGALSGTYPSPGLADNTVTTAKVADAAVTTAKLADNAVDAAKLANDAVDTGALQINSVDTGAIESDGVRGNDFFADSAQNFDPPIVTGNSCVSTTRNTGVLANVITSDQVVVTAPASLPAGLVVQAIALGGGVALDFCNVTAGALDPPTDNYDILVISD